MKKRISKWGDDWVTKHKDVTREEAEKAAVEYYKRAKNINRAGKVAMIATPILAAGGTALALRKKNKKEE